MGILEFIFYSMVLVAALWFGNMAWCFVLVIVGGVIGWLIGLFKGKDSEDKVDEYLANLDKGTVTVGDEQFNSDNLENLESEELVEG